ncbi:hypothetical protein B0H16DRAFT_1722293 [Mycena metata]|uniref:HAT C-terminal dimerisation domain-containing protein n=1 Tax=Mycena metata TaxID=1033252 RepID=A0AAD7ND12_9AGAR|nr:hypothetical protein B0H16DRAFT_1722293 [Mycena metata]
MRPTVWDVSATTIKPCHTTTQDFFVVAKGMMERIEKRWLALNQSIFVVAMILNPYECLERFGDMAGLNAFNLNTEVVALYRRIRSRPRPTPRPEGENERAEKAVSVAFMHYLGGTGDFLSWKEHKASFQELHPDEPSLMWAQMKTCKGVSELANFAMLLLDLVVNQASNERSFSDLKIKKTVLRNRLGTKKLEKMSKVGASIRTENLAAGIPRYADAVEGGDDEDDARPSKAEEEDTDNDLDSDTGDDTASPAAAATKAKAPPKLFPRSLKLLFGGVVKKPVGRPRRGQFTWEVLMMELLAAEESDEDPDDGALSGSGDEFEP